MRKLIATAIFCSFMIGCTTNDVPDNVPNPNPDVDTTSNPRPRVTNVSGVIQKGPFVSGSKVTIVELDENLNMTGKTFHSTIINDKGEFSVNNILLSTNYVQLIVDGFFFNEITGRLSDAPITMYALSDIKDKNTVNVNVLTHLETERVKHLCHNEGKTFTQAKEQALKEVLSAFYIKEKFDRSESFDLTSNSNASHVLLAISSIIANENGEALMTELMSKISSDIADNGVVDAEKIKQQIDDNSVALYKWHLRKSANPFRKINAIRANTVARYKGLGVDIDLTNFERYIDRNGNRDISDNKPTSIENVVFTEINNVSKADALYFSNEISLDNIADSVIMWLPGIYFGYVDSIPSIKRYCLHGVGVATGGAKDLFDKYGILDKYIYPIDPDLDWNVENFSYNYLSNGLVMALANDTELNNDSYSHRMVPSMHVLINDKPMNPRKAEKNTVTLYKGDKLNIVINPYHALIEHKEPELDGWGWVHPALYPLDVPEEPYRGKTALGTLFIEGQQIDFKVSVKK